MPNQFDDMLAGLKGDKAALLRALNPADPVREICTQIYNDYRESHIGQIELMMLACNAGQMRQLTVASDMVDRYLPPTREEVQDWHEPESMWDREPNVPFGEPDAVGDDLRALAREINRSIR